MKDDGIAICLAGKLHNELCGMGVDVIYGETDIGYCITQITEGDFLILMDASDLGKSPGEITLLSFDEITPDHLLLTQHGFRFLDLLRLYFPKNDGIVLAVEIAEAGFHYGLSPQLQGRFDSIAGEALNKLASIINSRNF
jgi:hydrogenase maturation protease